MKLLLLAHPDAVIHSVYFTGQKPDKPVVHKPDREILATVRSMVKWVLDCCEREECTVLIHESIDFVTGRSLFTILTALDISVHPASDRPVVFYPTVLPLTTT